MGVRSRLPRRLQEALFQKGLALSVLLLVVILLAMCVTLYFGASPALRYFGGSFVTGTEWNPAPPAQIYAEFPFTGYPPFVATWLTAQAAKGVFGVVPFLAGTLLTSFLALLLSLPFSLAIAVLLGEFRRSGRLADLVKSFVDLISAIPSVIYGLWGLMVLVPLVQAAGRHFDPAVQFGTNVLSASLVLAVMIIPNTASIAREVIGMVPADLKEAAYSLGATRYEVVRRVVLPHARSGILAGVLLSLGRALGETMAVTMVIGNLSEVPSSLLAPANTMASVIANELAESTSPMHYSALVGVGLVLFAVTALINTVGTVIIKKSNVQV